MREAVSSQPEPAEERSLAQVEKSTAVEIGADGEVSTQEVLS